MSFQDYPGDTMTTHGADVPPLVGYGADSTLNTNSGADAIPTSVTPPAGATPAMNAPQPSGSPQSLGGVGSGSASMTNADMQTEELEEASWDLRRIGLISGVVAAGVVAGAGVAWYLVSQRRAERLRIAERARLAAQSRGLLRFAPSSARQRLSEVVDSGTAMTALARQSAQEAASMAVALADSAMTIAQTARDRAAAVSAQLVDQTSGAAQDAQSTFNDTWGRTRATATTSWQALAQILEALSEASSRTAKVASVAAEKTAKTASAAAEMTAKTAKKESKRAAKVARVNYERTRKVATR